MKSMTNSSTSFLRSVKSQSSFSSSCCRTFLADVCDKSASFKIAVYQENTKKNKLKLKITFSCMSSSKKVKEGNGDKSQFI